MTGRVQNNAFNLRAAEVYADAKHGFKSSAKRANDSSAQRWVRQQRHGDSDQSPPPRDVGGFGAVLGLQFAEDVRHMIFDRAFGQVQFVGDFLVGDSLGQHHQHFALAFGQRLHQFARRMQRGAQGARGNLRLDEHFAVMHARMVSISFGAGKSLSR